MVKHDLEAIKLLDKLLKEALLSVNKAQNEFLSKYTLKHDQCARLSILISMDFHGFGPVFHSVNTQVSPGGHWHITLGCILREDVHDF